MIFTTVKQNIRRLSVFLLLTGFITQSFTTEAQINQPGTPVSFTLKDKSVFPIVQMTKVNPDELLKEDAYTDTMPDYPYRFAKVLKVNLSLDNSGLWQEIKGKGRIWRLGIKSVGAYSLNLIFQKYDLPPGARLFLYNPDHSMVLGAFTEENNKPWGSLAIAPVRGDEIIIEYFEPGKTAHKAHLVIGSVGYAYRDILGLMDDRFGLSQPCNKDINCSDGAEWQYEKHAVCRIIFTKLNGNSYLCSGSLINNAKNNEIPYFLSANHCLPTSYEAQTAVYYFNYESPACNGGDGDISQTLSGSTIQATTTNLDFSLVKMSDTIPETYKPYFAGWNASPQAPEKVVSIHHPQGDVKKIAIYIHPPVTGNFMYEFDYDDSTHWYIDNWTYGITEGGSSGSPLFDQNHLIVGDLTGGSVVANCTSADAFYEKFSHSFADYSDKREQLRYWLDPDTTGIISLNGFGPAVTGMAQYAASKYMVKIFPNPSDGVLTLELNDPNFVPNKIEISNILGEKVFEVQINPGERKIMINLSHLKPGLFLLTLSDKKRVLAKKIMITGK